MFSRTKFLSSLMTLKAFRKEILQIFRTQNSGFLLKIRLQISKSSPVKRFIVALFVLALPEGKYLHGLVPALETDFSMHRLQLGIFHQVVFLF